MANHQRTTITKLFLFFNEAIKLAILATIIGSRSFSIEYFTHYSANFHVNYCKIKDKVKIGDIYEVAWVNTLLFKYTLNI